MKESEVEFVNDDPIDEILSNLEVGESHTFKPRDMDFFASDIIWHIGNYYDRFSVQIIVTRRPDADLAFEFETTPLSEIDDLPTNSRPDVEK
jgi:hypothetical protein